MENKVVITANPKTGEVFTPNAKLGKDGKEWGYFRVESEHEVVRNGIFGVVKRSALVATLAENKDRIKAGRTRTGKIIWKDSLDEAPGYRPLQVPNKETGDLIPVTSGGMQVYRRVEFTEDLNAVDERLVYDREGVTNTQVANASAEAIAIP